MSKKYAYGVCLYKISKFDIEILLCKSVKSFNNWGLLKGCLLKNETLIQCAKREFEEESSIQVDIDFFEDYFEQKNEDKDVGIWLYNVKNIKNIDKYIVEGKLLENHLSWENSKVKFFTLDHLPDIKDKQESLVRDIKGFLESKHQRH